MTRLTHSYSAITLFENCPLRYYRQRVLKDVVDEGGEASRYGERLHKMLEDRLRDGIDLPKEEARYEPVCKATAALAEAMGGTLYAEYECSLDENLNPVGWFDKESWIRSKLDVLIVAGERAVTMDWKTGKRKMDDSQLELAALQIFKHFPEVNEVVASLVWLKTLQQDRRVYRREDSNKLWAAFMTRIRRIHTAQEREVWPAKPSGLCRYCPARHDCDFANV